MKEKRMNTVCYMTKIIDIVCYMTKTFDAKMSWRKNVRCKNVRC